MEKPFLSARWQNLLLLNYECSAEILEQYRPTGVELDTWEGRSYISIVGFQFLKTKIRGIPILYHSSFVEVNLRFYVKRLYNDEIRRGVVFIKELDPKPLVSIVAKALYDEPYSTTKPMIGNIDLNLNYGGSAEYEWQFVGSGYRIKGEFEDSPNEPVAGSLEEFITEHYWGYTKRRNGATSEYKVTHPCWKLWQAQQFTFEGDISALYGTTFHPFLSRPACNGLLAIGSDVEVYSGIRIS